MDDGWNGGHAKGTSAGLWAGFAAVLFSGILMLGQTQAAPVLSANEETQHPGPAPVDWEQFVQTIESLEIGETCDLPHLRPDLLKAWARQYGTLRGKLTGRYPLPPGADRQVHDAQTLVGAADRDPLDIVLRRLEALLELLDHRFGGQVDTGDFHAAWQRVSAAAERAVHDAQRRRQLYYAACALRRQVAFTNPLLDFDQVLFVARANDTRGLWSHGGLGDGRHLVTQYYAFASQPGGGIYVVENFKSQPRVRNLLEGRTIANGPFARRRIDGGVYLSPELSFDGQRLLFSWAPIQHWEMRWEEHTVWQIYEAALAGGPVRQLTEGPYNDFDPCYLPDGRIAFISERRGGYVRCFDANWPNRNYVLHSMAADGSDIVPLSWFETCEWQPSLAHDGRLVYTRWDYIDRDLGQGQNFWIKYPDGRDPRAPHGNYPPPHHVPADADPDQVEDGRQGRPLVQLGIRAVPNSARYIACAAPQHGLGYGSLILIDQQQAPDDGRMSQIRRLTPYQPFPETEGPAFSSVNPNRWATPWPLDDDFYLASHLDGVYLLDRFGNPVRICGKEQIPGWQRQLWANHRQGDHGFRLLNPMPVAPRPRPPILPRMTNQGVDACREHPHATLRIMNVYDSDVPLPEGVEIKWLRIVQHLVRANSQQDDPNFGPGVNNSARMALGLAPVEPDGSVHSEAPVGKLLIFQLLDENYRAVHSMRSATYVHPGEQLTCRGCHEHPTAPDPGQPLPLAMQRPPSLLEPEVGGVEPITYYRTVAPVFEQTCLPCHERQEMGPRNMEYPFLEPYLWYYYGGGMHDVSRPLTGGTRTQPGRFGARQSRMGQALESEHHRGKISPEDYRRVVLWLDNNSPRYGASHSTDRQERGERVWPKLDVDPLNPLGVERLWDAAGRQALNQPAYLSISHFHRLRGTLPEMRERPDWTVSEQAWDGGPGEPRGRVPPTWRDWTTAPRGEP